MISAPRYGTFGRCTIQKMATLDELSQYMQFQRDNPDKTKCFLCDAVTASDSKEASKYVLMTIFDDRVPTTVGGLELQYHICPDCSPIVKQKLIQKGDMSDMMKHSCSHILEAEAEEEFDTGKE